jgi:nucleoside-diphosphate-sugar epimerase
MELGLRGARVVVTGASGLMGLPVARALAADNEVAAVSRFSDPVDADELRAAGAMVVRWDLSDPDLSPLPDAADVVLHLGAVTTASTNPENRKLTFEANVHGTGRLMLRYPDAAFVHASSASTYAFQGDRALREDDPYGLHNGLEQYAASKIAAEQLVTFLSRENGVRAIIVRIFSAYGPRGGAPTTRVDQIANGIPIKVYPGVPNRYCPIYETDYVEKFVRASEFVDSPAPVVNFAGTEICTLEEYCSIAGQLLGKEPRFDVSDKAPYPLFPDTTKMAELLGTTKTSVADGIAAVVGSSGRRAGSWTSWSPGSE